MPQVERARQAQIVAFEAQNAIPYPLNEVIWDSQVMASDGVEAEVLLFALRTEVATKIATLVTSTGLRPMSIQAAPLLDSQAFRLAGGSAAEEVLIINVGARSTTLSFVGPGGVNIQSATNIGGNLLTQGVSDNTGQPFAVSEAIKVGYFSGIVQLAEIVIGGAAAFGAGAVSGGGCHGLVEEKQWCVAARGGLRDFAA